MTQTTVKNLKNPTFNSKTYKTPQKKSSLKNLKRKLKKNSIGYIFQSTEIVTS